VGEDIGYRIGDKKEFRIAAPPAGNEAMTGKTVTRADLSEAVYQMVGLSRTESADLVELFIDEICDCIVRGEAVKLSSFGSFIVRKKGERIGRNPKTGEEVPISPRRVMVFKPSNVLKQRINEKMVDGAGGGASGEKIAAAAKDSDR
jgi:integration host factor subunit alpha